MNPAGLDFYDRLVDELLGNGIDPFVTLFHWDTPQALEDLGGWPARDTVDAFSEYVEVVAERLGDRVRNWITHNEPWVVAWIGHGWGHHAPGRTSEPDALATAHHLLLSHGRAVEILRRASPGLAGRDHPEPRPRRTPRAAIPPTSPPPSGSTASTTAGSSTRSSAARTPRTWPRRGRAIMPEIHDGDLETISAPIDFLGVNNYSSPLVAADPNGGRSRIVRRPDAEHTDMGWEITPDGLHDLLVRLKRDYAPEAIYVTENGAAFPDVRGHDGSIGDLERQAYLERLHLGGRPRGRGGRPAARATSPGRCSTTSSGPGATGSASG